MTDPSTRQLYAEKHGTYARGVAHGRRNRAIGCGCPESSSVFYSTEYGEGYISGWMEEDSRLQTKWWDKRSTT